MPQANQTLPITRQQIESHVEALIDLLDSLDPDPDLEPSIGFTNIQDRYGESQDGPNFAGNANAGDDREMDDEREPGEDAEPSLGWTDNLYQGCAAWLAATSTNDLEAGAGAVRKHRPPSKTGGDVYRGCRVLGHPPATPQRNPMVLRVRAKGRASR